jgi:uncharacterized protein DUF5317
LILPLVLVLVAMVGGAIAGRTLVGFPAATIRSWWLAPIGLVLQAVPGPGDLDYVPLVISFVVLLIFVGVNVRLPGFILLLVGITLNLLVIASNLGMPVTREALRDSGQLATLETLAGDTKHRLATRHTVLRPLGDAIGLPAPFAQVVSAGDLCMYVGLAWFAVVAMPPRRVRGSRMAIPRGGDGVGGNYRAGDVTTRTR